MKILILVAHPDDEIIMCGATIDKLVKKGHQIFVTYFTTNDQAFFGNETQNKRRKRAINEAVISSKMLKYSTNFIKLQDMQLEKDKGLLIQQIIKEVRRVKPSAIITHNQHDKHIDHRTLAEIIPEANFQSGQKLCGGNTKWTANLILKGEVDLEMTAQFNFQVISIISEKNLKIKLRAFSCYQSVNDEHGKNKDWLINKINLCARLRGETIECRFGEAFSIDNYVPLKIEGIKIMLEILS